jgi:hypothetical protein
MARIRRLVLDVLKPHNPSMLEMSETISGLESVSAVNATLFEVDEKVENIKMTLVGDEIDFETVKSTIEDVGGSLHSVDEAVCGDEVVEESKTPQDSR